MLCVLLLFTFGSSMLMQSGFQNDHFLCVISIFESGALETLHRDYFFILASVAKLITAQSLKADLLREFRASFAARTSLKETRTP